MAELQVQIHDCLITFGDEVEFIWGSKWNYGKLLYFATKYLGYIDSIMILACLSKHPSLFRHLPDYVIADLLDHNMEAQRCKQLTQAYSYLTVNGVVLAELVMACRVYALWGKSRRVLLLLSILMITEVTVAVIIYTIDHRVIFAPPTPDYPSCLMLYDNNKPAYIEFALLMAFEFVVMLLTFWKGFEQWRGPARRSTLLETFYRDGALYFFSLFAFSTANFVIWYRLHPINGNYYVFLVEPQRVLHSVVTARMILNLRETTSIEEGSDVALTSLNFRCCNIDSSNSGWPSGTESTLEGDLGRRPDPGNQDLLTPTDLLV
ncbi:hypothetical protein M0805_004048 [Coniferiporia weirii]|nr:hypothetical protein M0805_004048 [Coniferiporia weirii]